MLTRLLLGRFALEVFVQAKAGACSRLMILGRHSVVDEPGEYITDRALPGFVAVEPGDDAAHHHAAHAIHLAQLRR